MTAFSDDFATDTGNLSDRTGWGNTREVANNTEHATHITIGSDVIARAAGDGLREYILVDGFTPGSPDYFVQIDTKTSVEDEEIILPFIRGAVGATGATGYYVRINPASNAGQIYKYVNGTRTELAFVASFTALDWTTLHTVKLEISGSGTTVINLYIDGNFETSYSDSSSPITAAGLGGLFSYWQSGFGTRNADNFVIDDGIAAAAVMEQTHYRFRADDGPLIAP